MSIVIVIFIVFQTYHHGDSSIGSLIRWFTSNYWQLFQSSCVTTAASLLTFNPLQMTPVASSSSCSSCSNVAFLSSMQSLNLTGNTNVAFTKRTVWRELKSANKMCSFCCVWFHSCPLSRVEKIDDENMVKDFMDFNIELSTVVHILVIIFVVNK